MLNIFIFLSIVEIFYLAFSFNLAMAYGQWSYNGEIIRTVARVICLLIYGWVYYKYFRNRRNMCSKAGLLNSPFLVAASFLLGFAIIDSNGINESAGWQLIFFISGIIAGFREELLYRGIIQKTLQNRCGYQKALLMTSFLFAISHIQYIYFDQINGLLLITCAGFIFGCVYIYSQSIIVTAVTHGLYDALLSVSFISYKLSANLELPLFVVITLLFINLIRKPLAGLQNNVRN